MENRDYETILNAMPETGVFVIRESDCGLLYVNRRAEESSSQVCLGASCCELWTHVCGRCPLLCMGDRQESKFASYNEPFGGMVDIMVTRTLWEEGEPAFVITVSPRTDAGCRSYREILRVDLFRDCCDLLKSVPDSWRMEGESLTEQMERFARSGAVYPPDVESFVAFVQPDRLRSALSQSQEPQSLLYRRRTEEGWCWNQMEVIPEQAGSDQSALLCVREIHSAPPAVHEREHTERDRQMAAILRARFKTMNTVELSSGQCRVADLSQQEEEDCPAEDYQRYMGHIAANDVHPEDAEAYRQALCLEHLREKAASLTGDCEEEISVFRRKSDPDQWTEVRVIYSRQGEDVMVNILKQDVTSAKRREISREQAMEDRSYIISSLSSLFFSTYYIDLEQNTFRTVTQLSRVRDVLGSEVNYTAALEIYANHFIHPDDRVEYLEVMGISNLRRCLRWWKPYVAVEYRKLSEDQEAYPEGWGWVRATAVLARTGRDDMPGTVVYAAQDITDSKRKA